MQSPAVGNNNFVSCRSTHEYAENRCDHQAVGIAASPHMNSFVSWRPSCCYQCLAVAIDSYSLLATARVLHQMHSPIPAPAHTHSCSQPLLLYSMEFNDALVSSSPRVCFYWNLMRYFHVSLGTYFNAILLSWFLPEPFKYSCWRLVPVRAELEPDKVESSKR